MTTRKSIKKLLLLIPVLCLLFNSCKHDDLEVTRENENFRSAADFIKNNYDLSLFYAALVKSGLTAELQGNGPLTVLAPNNTAFQQIGISRASDFDKMNQDSLKALVQLHIMTYRLLSTDIPFNGVDIRYRSMGGVELYVSSCAQRGEVRPVSTIYFNGSTVVKRDVPLANGTLQVLNKVMKYTPSSTVQDWLAKRPQYSIFVSGLKKFGLWDKLATAGPYTVFAPQNKVFEAGNITEASIAALNPAVYSGKRLFGGYIFNRKHFFLSDFNVFRLNNGEDIVFRTVDDDNWLIRLSASEDFFTKIINYTMNLRTPVMFYHDFKTVESRLPGLADNLTDNGLVHDVQGLLLLPEEAIIDNTPKN